MSLGLEAAWSPALSTAGRAVHANWTAAAAIGVPVCEWPWSSTTTCGAAAT